MRKSLVTIVAATALTLCSARAMGQDVFQSNLAAAKDGDAEAMYKVAVMYNKGYKNEVKRDDQQAVYWMTRSAERGNATAQVILGEWYYGGGAVKQDYAEAFSLFKKAADQGNAYGEFYVGHCYQYGQGVEADGDSAILYLDRAAQKGHGRALYKIGQILCLLPDYENAKSYLENALKTNMLSDEEVKSAKSLLKTINKR